ncbi:MBL fold metallo-hydrolase [Brevundimonas sp.]|uniref:MBL fold metallo-hydrolase n=1 Tax=Brevundimonas sp. TaxID=1871086 RepID=UPI002D44A744|nr:MBL fold metallo-hydrolase [Brevundimonas sp.]HYD26813.1 MBL fold metallo-hydrolase [Brevundimonas sp.]
MTPSFKIAAAGLMLATLAGVAGCSREGPAQGDQTAAKAAVPAPVSPDVSAVRIGTLEATALRDGTINITAGDAKTSPWTNVAEVSALLTSTGVTDGTIHLSIQPLLVRDGERVVLIDAGAGGQMGTEGKLTASLRAAGVEPGQVTDVLISHAHGDHVGGLVGPDGQLTFPNATVRMSAPEWAYARASAEEAGAGALLAAITPKVEPFAPGAQVTPSIKAVPLAGHTPGHSGYEIVSGEDRLLYIGDAMHSSVISVQRPQWRNAWDSDNAAAVATRQDLLERGVTGTRRIYGVHFPFPGVGRFQRVDDGFVWIPDSSAQP